MVPVGSQLT
jgi:hypothetical protein